MPDRPADVQILEKGNIIFFYRPKKGVQHPKGPQDLERSYFLLLPDDQRAHKNRLFNVAHGVFPLIQPGVALPEERDWAFVQDVGDDPRDVLSRLQQDVAAAARPAEGRIRPWARVAGRGRYAIVRHENHTHLAYSLAQPPKGGEVQRELEIKPEASYVISVKEPYAPSEIVLEKKPAYPDALRRKFNGHGWIPVDPTSFLDYQWTQVLLIGARTDVRKELGITLQADKENQAEQSVFQLLREEEKQAEKQGISLLEPLETGEWE